MNHPTTVVANPHEDLKNALRLIQDLNAVVCDFMPNIGGCALQNYQRLNESLVASERMLTRHGLEVPTRGTWKRV